MSEIPGNQKCLFLAKNGHKTAKKGPFWPFYGFLGGWVCGVFVFAVRGHLSSFS
jgi:hypothetical protein